MIEPLLAPPFTVFPGLNQETGYFIADPPMREKLVFQRMPITLQQVCLQVDAIRFLEFGGLLPETLERVLSIYLELAREKSDQGEDLDGIPEAIDQAVENYRETLSPPTSLELEDTYQS